MAVSCRDDVYPIERRQVVRLRPTTATRRNQLQQPPVQLDALAGEARRCPSARGCGGQVVLVTRTAQRAATVEAERDRVRLRVRLGC